MKPFTLTTAKNGLQILKVPREGTEAVTVQFMFRAGSRYETKDVNGLAHFNEHLVFKGGKRYPTSKQVSDAFNSLGAYHNAYTSNEMTAFYAKSSKDHAPTALDVMSDILSEPKYDATELDRERGVILEEINMYEDNPASLIHHVLQEALYPDHPLGREVLGPKKNIRSFTPEQFSMYNRTFQTPDRSVLLLAGNLDGVKDKDIDEAVARFSGTSDVAAESYQPDQSEPFIKVRKRDTEQTHLAFAVRGPSLGEHEDLVTMEVLSTILGGNDSSRLFTEVREKQGLAYYIHTHSMPLSDTGSLGVFAGVTHEKADKAVAAALVEIKKIQDGDVDEAELSMGKESLKGRLALSWENSSALAEYYGEQQLLLGKVIPPAKLLEDIEAVTSKDLTSLAQRIGTDHGLTLAVIGPHEEDKFRKLLSFS